MTVLFLYVVASSTNPDWVECVVPYRIDEKLIFFGPCKKRLRERLRNQYLKTSAVLQPEEDIFVIGLNGGNSQRVRKIVWAGRINRLMTFETAYNTLTGPEFQEMRSHEYSPLHLKPVYDRAGKFLGYQHISREHEESWVLDIVGRNDPSQVEVRGNQLLLRPGSNRQQIFGRDCCFLCDNLFFAAGTGQAITDEMLALLQQAQPTKQINSYALFGYRNDGSAEGLTGSYLAVEGQLARDFIDLVKSRLPQSSSQIRQVLKPCGCR